MNKRDLVVDRKVDRIEVKINKREVLTLTMEISSRERLSGE